MTGDGDADGVVLGVGDAAAVAVTQSPGFSAAAVVVRVWLNVVVPVKLTVIWLEVPWTKMLLGLTCEILPVVPGLAPPPAAPPAALPALAPPFCGV